MKILLAILVLVCSSQFSLAQENEKAGKPQPAPSQSSGRSAESIATQHEPAMSKEDVQAMQADIQRMRVLIHQMQNNLGAVTSAQDPLKHEFELEIEMWQILLNQMDRRMQRASGK
jgi:hypothetical protein